MYLYKSIYTCSHAHPTRERPPSSASTPAPAAVEPPPSASSRSFATASVRGVEVTTACPWKPQRRRE